MDNEFDERDDKFPDAYNVSPRACEREPLARNVAALMKKMPCSAYHETGGVPYFSRMLDKIRLFASGDLDSGYHQNLGRGADGWCTQFLRVSYEALTARVLEGGSDEDILEWCYENGRRLEKIDLFVWKMFVLKLGWNDIATPVLEKFKEASGLAGRTDIQTMVEFFEVDEGRKP